MYRFQIMPSDHVMAPGLSHVHSLHAGDQSSFLNTTLSTSVPGTPDCKYTQNGPRLTPMGRFQVINVND